MAVSLNTCLCRTGIANKALQLLLTILLTFYTYYYSMLIIVAIIIVPHLDTRAVIWKTIVTTITSYDILSNQEARLFTAELVLIT